LSNNNDVYGLPIIKLRENTLLHIANVFLEVYLKLQISWQWQLHYGKYYGNNCFSVVWQPSTKHCIKMLMNLDCPYQNWVKTLYCTLSNTFLKAFLIFQASGQWQLHYDNTVEITVFSIVWQSSTEHCLKMLMNLDCPYQNWDKTLYCTCQTHSWKHY